MNEINKINKHKLLTLAIVHKFERDGFNVYASHIGHQNGPPPKWEKFQPDIYAYRGPIRYYIEIVTGKTINNKRLIEKLKAFSSKPGFKFAIATPKSNVKYIKLITKKNGIHYDKLWTLNIGEDK